MSTQKCRTFYLITEISLMRLNAQKEHLAAMSTLNWIPFLFREKKICSLCMGKTSRLPIFIKMHIKKEQSSYLNLKPTEIMFRYILRRPQKFEKKSHFALTLPSNFFFKMWDFFKIFWPSYNIWTLKPNTKNQNWQIITLFHIFWRQSH